MRKDSLEAARGKTEVKGENVVLVLRGVKVYMRVRNGNVSHVKGVGEGKVLLARNEKQ